MAIQRYRVDDGYYDDEGNYVDNSYWEEYDDGVPEYDFGYGDDNTGTDTGSTTDSWSSGSGLFVDQEATAIADLPVGQRTNMGEGVWVTRNSDGSVSYEDPDGSTYTKTANGNYTTGSGASAVTYNPSSGTFTDSTGKPLQIGAGGASIPKSLQRLFVSSDGSLNLGALLPLLGGAYAVSQSGSGGKGGGASGYQGTIPTYTATRQAPGIGQLLSGNVLFKAPDTTQTNEDGTTSTVAGRVINPNTAAPSTGIAPSARQVAAAPEAAAPEAAVQNMAKGGSLEPGGFVIPADVVSHVGNGSSSAGLRLLAEKLGARPIKGKGDGMSDSIPTTVGGRQPARVANEEAALSKAQVDALGGAKKLYAMMDRIRQARTGTKQQGKKIDPNKFMPGGAVQGYAVGGVTTAAPFTTGSQSSLSNWAGDYVTDMLAKGKALSEMPYEQYQGPLTAGASDLQTKVSTGLNNTAFPSNLGTSFSSTGAYQAPNLNMDAYKTQPIGTGAAPAEGGITSSGIASALPTGAPASTGPTGIAAQYMNPYLQSVLTPQLEEMRRQAKINNMQGLGAFTKSGAFGGGRQAIMESENARNLLGEQNDAIGKGYATAYDKGLAQFNTEQGQAKSLAELMAGQGATDRGITADDVAANKAQFEEARLNPYKMVQFQQSLLDKMPLESKTYQQAEESGLTQFANTATTINNLLGMLKQTGT